MKAKLIVLSLTVAFIGFVVLIGYFLLSSGSSHAEKVDRVFYTSHIEDKIDAEDEMTRLFDDMNGYSKNTILDELRIRGCPEDVLQEIKEELKDEDFSGEANMALGLLLTQNRSLEDNEAILKDLGFEKTDYEWLIESEKQRKKNEKK